MWIQRRKQRPLLPKSREETLAAMESVDLKRDTVVKTDKEKEIGCFYSIGNLRHMKNVDYIFGDGTFKSCPKHFYQLYTISVYKQNIYVPVIFFLLPGKSKQIYIDMFQMFVKIYQEVNDATLDSKILHLDFEKQAHEAAKEVIPNVTLKGCLFHLKQSWWRKIQELGLANDYRDQESAIGKFLKSTFGLPFLDYVDIFESFAFDVMLDAPADERVDPYLDYLMKTYMTSLSLFPPTLWASSDFKLKRTTNACEAFHKQLNSMFYRAHPSIFELLDRLQEVMLMNQFKINSSNIIGRKTAEEARKLSWMTNVANDFIEGKIDRKTYIGRVCYNNLPLTTL